MKNYRVLSSGLLKKASAICVIPLISFSLYAEEAAMTKDAEGGLIHTKQKGRYEVVKTLPQEAESFDMAFDYAKPFATFRLANVATQQEALPSQGVEELTTNGTSFGGIFGFDTASLYGAHLHLGAYVSQKVRALNPQDAHNQNSELFTAGGDSYVYLGEASLAYESDIVQSKIGRIRIDTPYADSDDIRMSPNSFEGAWAKANLGNSWRAQAYYLTRWAGTDSENVAEFESFVDGGYGVAGAALAYKINSDNKLSLWYYNVDKESDIVYAEGTGEFDFSETFHMEWGIQGAHITERDDSEIEGDVVGAMVIVDYDFVYFGGAYNYVFEADGNTITDGFGGGPYYTSLDEQTIGAISALAPGDDLRVYRLALGVDLTTLGVKQLNMEIVHGHFNLERSPAEAIETDLVLTYAITDRWYFESIYTNVNLKNVDYTNPENWDARDFQRLVTRLDYSF